MSGYLAWKRKSGQRLFIEGGIEIKLGKTNSGEAVLLIKAPGLHIERPTKEMDALDRASWVIMKGDNNAAQ